MDGYLLLKTVIQVNKRIQFIKYSVKIKVRKDFLMFYLKVLSYNNLYC